MSTSVAARRLGGYAEQARTTPAAWQRVWREGIAPQFTTAGLEALALALECDDLRLLQGATTSPPPLQACASWPVEACCAVSWPGWQGGAGPHLTVADLEWFFAKTCHEADRRLHEPAAIRWFMVWYDESPREEVRRLLLAEVEAELGRRAG